MEPTESFKMSKCKVKNYYNQHLRRHHQIQQQQQRNMFLPIMLCAKTSIKDVNFSSHQNRRQTSPTSPIIISGCVCQSAAKRNNKVVSIGTNPSPNPPSSSTAIVKSSNNNSTNNSVKKQRKFRKFFLFSKSVTTSSSTSTSSSPAEKSTINGSRRKEYSKDENSCRIRAKCGVSTRQKCRFGIVVKPIDIAKLDPPLPVVKKQSQSVGVESESLWKRRSGGPALRCLQVQPIHVAGGGVAVVVDQSAEVKTV